MTTDNVRYPQVGALSELQGWLSGELGACLVKLYVSNTPYLPTRVASDYTEASYAGYAPISAPAWGTPFINGMGQAETDSPVLTWTFSGSSGVFTVFGVFITDATGATLLAVVPFTTPVDVTPSVPSITRTIQIQAIDSLA